MFYQQSCIFAEFPLDPCDVLRGDIATLAKLKTETSTRFLFLRTGKPL